MYGIDHIEGLFVIVYTHDKPFAPIFKATKKGVPELTVSMVIEIAERYGFDLSAEFSEEIIQ